MFEVIHQHGEGLYQALCCKFSNDYALLLHRHITKNFKNIYDSDIFIITGDCVPEGIRMPTIYRYEKAQAVAGPRWGYVLTWEEGLGEEIRMLEHHKPKSATNESQGMQKP